MASTHLLVFVLRDGLETLVKPVSSSDKFLMSFACTSLCINAFKNLGIINMINLYGITGGRSAA